MTETGTPSGAAVGATRTAWLTAHGRQPWPQIGTLLTGCTCAWADLDGFHAGEPPADPPLATHLWAWGEGRLLRVRVDGAEGITAELHLTRSGKGQPVTVTEHEASSWPSEEGRVSVAPQWRARTVTIYRVEGIMPLEFTRLGDPGPVACG
jgi:hypothetical protein